LLTMADRCRARGEAEAERIFGRRARVLSSYQPQLASLPGQQEGEGPQDAVDLPAEAAQLRLYTYLGETLLAFAGGQPLLLVLDDLQWADGLSLGFLRFSQSLGPLRRWLLILGTYRREELPSAGEDLRALLGEPGVEAISLSRLSEEAVSA